MQVPQCRCMQHSMMPILIPNHVNHCPSCQKCFSGCCSKNCGIFLMYRTSFRPDQTKMPWYQSSPYRTRSPPGNSLPVAKLQRTRANHASKVFSLSAGFGTTSPNEDSRTSMSHSLGELGFKKIEIVVRHEQKAIDFCITDEPRASRMSLNFVYGFT